MDDEVTIEPAVPARPEPVLIRAKAASDVKKLASSVARELHAGNTPKLRSIGAAAVNQALKAIIIAAGYVAQSGIRLYVEPSFEEVIGEGGSPVTAVSMLVVTY